MLKLEIVTPEKKIYSDSVDQVSLPTPDGEITVLPHHIPLVTLVQPGELIVKKAGKTTYLVTGEGFVEVTAESVSVLTDLAVESAEIDEKAAEEARKRAEEALKQKHTMSSEEFAMTAANLQKALASLRVKRRHKKI
ncbi:MAG TPA: ATP synthase F1 subunit epsilon [Candidatus Saccharimonadales bacterium]|nr:ATP synthase F1 subunit epsilon [Candidatus Saccharimonadales bacterium]